MIQNTLGDSSIVIWFSHNNLKKRMKLLSFSLSMDLKMDWNVIGKKIYWNPWYVFYEQVVVTQILIVPFLMGPTKSRICAC